MMTSIQLPLPSAFLLRHEHRSYSQEIFGHSCRSSGRNRSGAPGLSPRLTLYISAGVYRIQYSGFMDQAHLLSRRLVHDRGLVLPGPIPTPETNQHATGEERRHHKYIDGEVTRHEGW